MVEHLLVYGTLVPGASNYSIIKNIPGEWNTATCRGKILVKDWGTWKGCPGIILSEDEDLIKGYVLSSKELKFHWERLDAFEGNDYSRVRTNAILSNGKVIKVYIYELKIPK